MPLRAAESFTGGLHGRAIEETALHRTRKPASSLVPSTPHRTESDPTPGTSRRFTGTGKAATAAPASTARIIRATTPAITCAGNSRVGRLDLSPSFRGAIVGILA